MQVQEQPNYDEYKERLTNFSNEFDLGLFFHILRRSIFWVIFCILLAVLGAFLYLKYTPPIYKAKVVLQLGQNDNAGKILNVSSYQEDNDLQAKLELLRSKLLVKNTLERLPVDISYYTKGDILTNENYTLSPYRVEIVSRDDDRLTDVSVFAHFHDRKFVDLSIGEKVYSNLNVNEVITIDGVELKLDVLDWKRVEESQSENLLYFVINNKNSLAYRFYASLDVRILNNTAKTLEIAFEDNNAFLARDFVMAHAEEFVRFDLDRKSQSDDNVISFIDSQVDTVFDRLRSSETLLNNYKQSHKLSDLDELSDAYFTRINEFETEIINLEIEEKLLREIEQLTKSDNEELGLYNLVPLVAGSRYEGALSGLLETLNQLLMEKERILYSVTPDNNKIKSLDYQIGIQQNLVVETIKALKDKITERKESLQEKMRSVEKEFYTLPTKELEFARLKRLFTINEKYYTMLLEKKIEYQISKEGFVSNNQVLEEARLPRVPLKPNRNLVIISFLVSGLLLCFLIVGITYILHQDITSLNDIVRISNASMSILGMVPKYKKDIPDSLLLINENPKSLIAEAFRNIRTNLQFVDNSSGPKLATVTSTISGEGKTFISLNLGGIIAYSGKKVVVIDLDMRKPKVHKGFGVDNDKGMSTLLIGRSSVDECLRQSDLENLFFITAGPIPPNPSELIINRKMDEILDELKQKFDIILVDTPPIGLVTDGMDIIRKADYPIYVFRSDYSKKSFVQSADRLKNESGIDNLGVVLNGVDMNRSKYSYKYGYGNSYGYGYGYGYGSNGYYTDTESKKSFWDRFKK